MRYSVILALLILGCSSPTEESNTIDYNNQQLQQSTLLNMTNHPVVFYNVENLFDTKDDPNNPGDDEFTIYGFKQWDDERYQTKLKNLQYALSLADGEAPLFIGLAEIENRDVLVDLSDTGPFKSVNYKITHFDSEDRRGIDCGFIYDADRFSPTLETKLVVKMEDDPNFKTRDILYIKGKLSGDTEIHVFVNHWSSRREGQAETEPRRIAAAKILRAKIDEITNYDPKANIIVMGDFNDTPLDVSIHNVLKANSIHDLRKGNLVNLLYNHQKRDEGTSVHRGDWDVIDQLIVSQSILHGQSGLKLRENTGHILRDEKLLYTYHNGDQKPNATYGGDTYYGGYSDHLPVYFFLEEKE